MTHLIPSVGERIRLIEMPNDPCPIEPGSLGTIRFVSPGPQQIGVKWDSGRTLHLVMGVDVFEIVTPHRVVLIEDNSYARYDVFVEATDADQAAGLARELVVDGKAEGGTQHSRDDALPYVTDVIDAAGEECGVSEEHEFEGVVVPDLLKARDICADVIETIDDFDVRWDAGQHTDVGQVWEILHQIRAKLHEALPLHMRIEVGTLFAEKRAKIDGADDEEGTEEAA